MTTQPEAQRLAECLDEPLYATHKQMTDAAAELRRLSAVEAQRDALLKTLKWLDRWMGSKPMTECSAKVLAAIKAVEGETK